MHIAQGVEDFFGIAADIGYTILVFVHVVDFVPFGRSRDVRDVVCLRLLLHARGFARAFMIIPLQNHVPFF